MSAIVNVLLVGFSPILVDVAVQCRDEGLTVALAFGPRQRAEWAELPEGGSLLAGNVDIVEAESFDEVADRLALNPSWLVVSMGAPFLFRAHHLDLVAGHVINMHAAPLPEYRGGGGYSWRIMNGDRRGAVLIHQITPGIDDGPVLFRRDYGFPPELRTPEQYRRYAIEQDRPAMLDMVRRIVADGELPPAVAQEGAATYFPRLSTDVHGAIDWSWPAPSVVDFVRAFDHPYPGAFTTLRGNRVRVVDAENVDWVPVKPHPFMSGLLVAEDGDAWIIAANSGYIRARILFDGPPPRLGDRLTTDATLLEAARAARVEYLPNGPVVRE